MSQLALELPHRPSQRGEDFLVTDSNRDAVALIDRWPDWPGHALALVGPAGAGKSHLAAVWQARSGAAALAPEEVSARSRVMMEASPAALIDDADRALAQARLDPVDLLHLYNWLKERGGALLLTARQAPAQWPVPLSDLRSRLSAMPLAQIGAPDETLLAAVLVKQLSDRQLSLDPKVVEYILARIERSFAAVDTAVAALDRESLAAKRAVTIPFARDVLTRYSLL